jgi:hypothetical protein
MAKVNTICILTPSGSSNITAGMHLVTPVEPNKCARMGPGNRRKLEFPSFLVETLFKFQQEN